MRPKEYASKFFEKRNCPEDPIAMQQLADLFAEALAQGRAETHEDALAILHAGRNDEDRRKERDEFAKAALGGAIAHAIGNRKEIRAELREYANDWAQVSYRLADAMLATRDGVKP